MNTVVSFCDSEPIRLTSTVKTVITSLCRISDPYTAKISEQTGIAHNTIQSVINQLAAKKYIEINPGTYKKIIYLTEAGYNLAIFCEAI